MDEADGLTIPSNILRHFDLSSTPYDGQTVKSIQRRRSIYPGGKLFFDRLLELAGIDGSTLYPPVSPAGYRHLLGAIHASPLDRLKKDCFYYYLLRDYGLASESDGAVGDEKRAGRFAKTRCLSKTWRLFIDGYWYLDNGQWENGIASLTYPGITEVNFPSEIINTLASLASPPSLACSLIHSFLLIRLPGPDTPRADIEIYTVSLASASSVGSAFSFIRSLDPAADTESGTDIQSHLRDIVWSWALGAPKTPCGKSDGEHQVQQRAIKEILHLPLLPEEDDHLLRFLLEPPRTIAPTALSLLHDLVTLRLIHQGKYAESLTLDKELAGSGGKEEDRQRRREMVRDFIAILPEAQRRALAIDGEVIAGRREKQRIVGNGYMEVDEQSAPVPAKKQIETIDLELDSPPPPPSKLSSKTQSYGNLTPAFPLERPAASPAPASAQVSRPASPAPASRVVSTNSPFSGPPRFAQHPNLPSTSSPQPAQLQRVLSGSPFTLPMSRGANAVRSASISRTPTQQSMALPQPLPIPRPKSRPVFQDEEAPAATQSRKRSRRSDIDVKESEGPVPRQAEREDRPEEAEMEEHASTPPPRSEVQDIAVHKDQHDQETEPEPEPESSSAPAPAAAQPKPEPTPRTRRSKRTTTTSPPAPALAPVPTPTPRRATRQSSLPPPSPLHPRDRLPGSFIDTNTNIPESVPENSTLQPPSTSTVNGASSLSRARKSRTMRDLSVTSDADGQGSATGQGRSRMTRSASRATLGEPDDVPLPKRARSRRLSAASEMSVPDMSMTPATATGKGRRSTRQAEQSERGSPTPSVRSRRAGSQTPRKSTRAKK